MAVASTSSGTSSISGLASGFDSTTVISQLMDIESAPQTLLKTKLTTAQTATSAYQAINSSFAALLSAAKTAASAATWTATAASSSNSTVSASAGAAAQTGSLAFTVTQLAAAHSVVSTQAWTTTATATDLGTSMTLSTAPTSPITLDTDGDGTTTLAEAVSAINASTATSGITATAVNTGSGYKLQLSASATGAAAVFTPTAAGGTTFAVSSQGQDAQLSVGSSNPYTVTSATNTFSEVLAGTTFTVSKAGESATISVSSNPNAATAAVSSLVDAANDTLKLIAAYTTASGNAADTAGVLSSDYSIKQLKSAVLDAVTNSVGGKSAASAGLEVDRYGAMTFDSTAFAAALKADPTGVQAIFQGTVSEGTDNVAGTVDDTVGTDGLAARISVLAAKASDSVNGSLTVMAKGQTDRAKDITDQIAAWDIRLAARKATLTAKFTAMESALATLSSQGSWLTSQINSLPSWSDD